MIKKVKYVVCPSIKKEIISNLSIAHPRVFLKVNDLGQATCPYCSTVYSLHKIK